MEWLRAFLCFACVLAIGVALVLLVDEMAPSNGDARTTFADGQP